MNKPKGSVISGRISRHARGSRAPSSALLSCPSSSVTHQRPLPPCHRSSPASSQAPPMLLACRSPSSSVSTLRRRAVMKMLAVMESSSRGSCESGSNSNDDIAIDFLTSGRTGRRNALPDILGETANVTVSSALPRGPAASDLPSQFQKLTCQDSSNKDAASEAGSETSQETNPQGERDPKRPDASKAEDSGGGRSTVFEISETDFPVLLTAIPISDHRSDILSSSVGFKVSSIFSMKYSGMVQVINSSNSW